MTTQQFQAKSDVSLVRKCLILSATIIIANFLIGIASPTLTDIDDEITFLDNLWRSVVGQRVGIDYHDPTGFGTYQLGALLWGFLGPHHYVMRLAITLFSLSISLCGCIVADRTLARRPDLALLFCATLAFQLSAPTAFKSFTSLSMAGFYNRHIVSALAVLFLLAFSSDSRLSMRDGAVEVALAAFLLNILFMTKISGYLLGLLILLGACLLQYRSGWRVLKLCAILLAFVAATVIEFKITGLELIPIIQDYELAAHARLLSFSSYNIVMHVFSIPLAISVAVLVLFAVSQRSGDVRLDFWRISLIIGSYAAWQFALNMTNSGGKSMWLAPAAVASLAIGMGVKPLPQEAGGSVSWWSRFYPSQLAGISAREALPFLIFALVLIPQVIASTVGITIGAFVSLGLAGSSIVLTAGNGVSIRSLADDYSSVYTKYIQSLNDAVTAIASLNLGHEAIANLDYANPFPVLFLAPPPKSIHVSWAWNDVPEGAVLEVIGDACVVTIPAEPDPDYPSVPNRLFKIAQLALATEFKIVHQDKLWSIYRRTRNCATAPIQ
jgi:hypothetical protein